MKRFLVVAEEVGRRHIHVHEACHTTPSVAVEGLPGKEVSCDPVRLRQQRHVVKLDIGIVWVRRGDLSTKRVHGPANGGGAGVNFCRFRNHVLKGRFSRFHERSRLHPV
jgi:hypothetical protein